MLTTEKTIHPLIRHGTTQRERLLKALVPENLQLDDRSIADVLAFVAKYAEQIRYWSPDNTPDGDWTCFWSKDATAVLAIVTSTDVDDLRVRYRNTELEFLIACKKEKAEGKTDCENAVVKMYDLIGLIYETATTIQKICEKLPNTLPLKAEVQSLIKSKLGIGTDSRGNKDYETPLGKLISYHKSSVKRELLSDYAPFIGESPCQQAWNLTEHDFLNCIDFKENINADDREDLWRLFLAFFKVLTLIVSKAEKAFHSALHGRSDHPPHIALFLAFVQLFRRYHQAEMNALLGKHLIYYYRDILRLQERREIPDRVHIIFEIAQNLETYRLKKGTLLLGGKDLIGIDRLYALADELVINKAKLVEKQNLYFYKVLQPNTINKYSKIPIRLPAADMKDGVKVPYTEGGKMWHPLSGLPVFQKVFFKKERRYFEQSFDGRFFPSSAEALVSAPGLIISTPELWMDKSDSRTITITFQDVNLENVPLTLKISPLIEQSINQISPPLPSSEDQLGNVFFIEKGKITIHLTSDFSAITPLKEDKTNPLSTLENPFILIQAIKGANYEDYKNLKFSSCKINTSSSGLRNVTLQLGDTSFPATSEIPLVGSTAANFAQSLTLYASAPELAVKNIDFIKNKPNVLSVNNQFTFGAWQPIVKEQIIKLNSDAFENVSQIKYSSNTPYTFYKQTVTINPPAANNQPINIYKIPSESIYIDYTSEPISLLLPNEFNANSPHKLYFFDFLDGYSEVNQFSMVPDNKLPEFDAPIQLASFQNSSGTIPITTLAKPKFADGNLRLAFELLQPGQSLSLLFHFADGTGNPDHIAPDEIVWSYLRQNQWVRIPPQYILLDETLGLRQTGIIKIQIPSDINSGNTAAKGKEGRFIDLFWIQASASEDQDNNIYVDALPMLIDIYPQAGTAVFENHNNDLAHIEKGLPESTITQLRFRDTSVSKVKQPFASFNGRLSEAGDRLAYYRRISERLRHKQRAITIWDYERLTLETFPKVAIAKCLSHTRDIDVERLNYVTLGVVPYPERMVGDRKFYPIFNAGDLEAIERYLNRHNTFFVSGWGGGVVCCCDSTTPTTTTGQVVDGNVTTRIDHDHDCCCHDGEYLLVRNALFEPIRLQVCVKFRLGKDIFFYKKQLNEDLKAFLAPWATHNSTPLLFGSSIYTTELLRFLENMDYIDVVMSIRFKHFPNREASEKQEAVLAFEEGEIIEPFTSRSVLTTYLDVLNEDNPNVIDHEINIIEDQDCCADCAGNNVVTTRPPDNNTDNNNNRTDTDINTIMPEVKEKARKKY